MVYNEDYYNDTFFENLKDVYGSYEVLDNGIIKAGSGNGNVMYLDTHYILDEADIYTCYPGDGGITGDAQYKELVNNINDENSPHFLVMTRNSHDVYHALDQAKEFIDSTGTDVTWNEVAFSGGGGSALDRLDTFLANNPDAQVGDIVLTDVDLYNCYSDCSHIKESDGTIYVVIPEYSNGYGRGFDEGVLKTIEPLYEKGLDVKIIKSPVSDHGANLNITVDKDGIMASINSGTLLDDYEVYDYLGNGEYEKATSASNKSNKHQRSCKIQVVDAALKFMELGNIDDDLKIVSKDGNIKSEYQYVASAMNKLRSQIKSYNFAAKNVQTFGSPTGIPGCIAGYINAYYNAIGTFMSSLEQETRSVISIAQTFVDMDSDFASGAERLGTPISSNDFNLIGITNPTQNSETPTLKGSPTKPQARGNVGGVSAPSAQASGGVGTTKTYAINGNDKQNKLYIRTDKNEIVDIKCEYNCSSADTAKQMYNDFVNKYKGNSLVENIILNNNNVDIVYKKGQFKNMSLEDIKTLYLNGGLK